MQKSQESGEVEMILMQKLLEGYPGLVFTKSLGTAPLRRTRIDREPPTMEPARFGGTKRDPCRNSWYLSERMA